MFVFKNLDNLNQRPLNELDTPSFNRNKSETSSLVTLPENNLNCVLKKKYTFGEALNDSLASNIAAIVMGKENVGVSYVVKTTDDDQYYICSTFLENHGKRLPEHQEHHNRRDIDIEGIYTELVVEDLINYRGGNGINDAPVLRNGKYYAALIDFDWNPGDLKAPFYSYVPKEVSTSEKIEALEKLIERSDEIMWKIDQVIKENKADGAPKTFKFYDERPNLQYYIYWNEYHSYKGSKIMITPAITEVQSLDHFDIVGESLKQNIAQRIDWFGTKLHMFKMLQFLQEEKITEALNEYSQANTEYFAMMGCDPAPELVPLLKDYGLTTIAEEFENTAICSEFDWAFQCYSFLDYQ